MANNEAHEKLVRDILLELSKLKIGRFWKNPRGVAMTRRGQIMTFGIPGQADISGILNGGFRAEIEVKTGSGNLKSDQINFKEMIETWGGFYFVARDLESTISSIYSFLSSKNSPS